MSDIRSVPLDLVEQITRGLSTPTLSALYGTARTFGYQPTSGYATSLVLQLPASQCCQDKLITTRLPHIATLSVQGSMLCDQSSSGAELSELVVRLGPSMPGLNTLILQDFTMAAVAAAAPHFVSACPQLTCLKLVDVKLSGVSNLQSVLGTLVDAPALRRLKITAWLPRTHTEDDRDVDMTSLQGIGALTHLESLSLIGALAYDSSDSDCSHVLELPLDDLSRLVGLRKLTLGGVYVKPQSADGPSPRLVGLSHLQHVKLIQQAPDVHVQEDTLTALAACSSLTGLRVTTFDGEMLEDLEGVFEHSWRGMQHLFPHLTRLELNTSDIVFCTSLVAMEALRVLNCSCIVLPPSGSPISLPLMRAVKCSHIQYPDDVNAGGPTPLRAQALTRTFPRLAAFVWLGWMVEPYEGLAADLMRLLPTTAEGHAAHLGRPNICHPEAKLLGRLTGSVEELVLGVVPGHGKCVGGAIKATGDSLAASIFSMTPFGATLRRVELSHSQLDNECLEALVAAWPLTEEVTVCGAKDGPDVRHVTDAGLAALRQLQNLRRVRLIRCSAITPPGISILMAQLSVEYVEVCGCALVGSAEVAALHNLPSRNGVCYGLRPSLHLEHSASQDKTGPWWGLADL